MLLASLISHTIAHTVIKLLTAAHANILCSDLHLHCSHPSVSLYCRSIVRSSFCSPYLCSPQIPWCIIISPSLFFWQNRSHTKWKTVVFLCSVVTLHWVSCWLTGRIPESLCWCVIAQGQQQANRSYSPHICSLLFLPAFFSLFFFLLSTIFLLPYKISRHPLNYWLVQNPVRLGLCCVVVHQQQQQQQHRAFFVGSLNQNENMQGFIMFKVRTCRIAFHTPYISNSCIL